MKSLSNITAKLVTFSILAGILSACGGGGGGGNGNNNPGPGGNTPPPTNTIMRPVVIEFDYDNNGTVDATSTLSYDAQGRLTLEEYVNTGDGTPDQFDLYDHPQVTNEYSYNADGRLLVHKRIVPDNTVEYTHQYDAAGNVTRIDVVTTSIIGTVNTYMLFTYNGNQAQQFDIYLTSDDSLLLTEQYSYDMQGRVTQDMGIFPAGGAGYVRQFTWDAENRLDLYEFDGDANGDFEISYDYVFNAQGKLSQRVNTNTVQPDPAEFDNFTEFFTYNADNQIDIVEYDNNNDGSLDATARIAQRESGPCTAVYLPLLSTKAGQDGIPGSDVGDIAWCE